MSAQNHEDTVRLIGPWRTSSYTNQGNCVEMAPTTVGVAMRNSNDHSLGTLHLSRSQLADFLAGCRDGLLGEPV